MKRKLIEFDVFEQIKEGSLSKAESELIEAAPYLAKTLNLEAVSLNCFDQEQVLYETVDGSYVKANYTINEGVVEFDDIEQLIINEDSERQKSKEIISQMLESLIESDEEKAEKLFEEWLDAPFAKRIYSEMRKKRVVPKRKDGKIVGYTTAYWSVTPKKRQKASTKIARSKGKVKSQRKTSPALKRMRASQRSRMKSALGRMAEWQNLSENAAIYVQKNNNGNINVESAFDEKGNVTCVKVPTSSSRDKTRSLQLDWKTLNNESIQKRKDAFVLIENNDFVKLVSNLRKQNALSKTNKFQDLLETLVTTWSEVVYLTEQELTEAVKTCLETVEDRNYDDDTCVYIAESILKTAHVNLEDRVSKIFKLAGTQLNEDQEQNTYESFKKVCADYVNKIDESAAEEMQVYVDLYEALRSVHEIAKEEEENEIVSEVSSILNDLIKVIQEEKQPSLELASEASAWLHDFVQANLVSEDWEAEEPHESSEGDTVEYESEVHISTDGAEKNEGEEQAKDGLGNDEGKDVYPKIENPFLLKNASHDDCKVHDEEEKEGLGDDCCDDKDVYPELKNPFQKAHGKEAKEE